MNMHTLLVIVAACLALPALAHACINETGTNSRAEQVELMSYGGKSLQPKLVTPVGKAALVVRSGYVVRAARENPSFYTLNDLAAVLIRHGRLNEAVDLLQFLERKYPGKYESAANLGTAYELMGRNVDALTWIEEGMKRNPEDHYGTEWLHVHILKAKLKRIAQPAVGRSILNLDFGNEAMPRLPPRLPTGNAGKPLPLFTLGLALRYQLLERIQFVAAPDTMVAGLLLDWANLELLAGTVESADVLYDAALRYGSKEGRQIAARKAQVARILAQSALRRTLTRGTCELCEPPAQAGSHRPGVVKIKS
jgi:tetratricopeptide (TPR) repeat protein